MDSQLEEARLAPVRVRRLGSLEGGDSEWSSGTSPLALFDLLVALFPLTKGGVYDMLCCNADAPLAATAGEENVGAGHFVDEEEADAAPEVATTVAERLFKLELELSAEARPRAALLPGSPRGASAAREAADTAAVPGAAAGGAVLPLLSARSQRLVEATAALQAAAAAMTVSALPVSPLGSSGWRSSSAASLVHAHNDDAAQRVAQFAASALAAARARRMRSRYQDGQPASGICMVGSPVHRLLAARIEDGGASPHSPAPSECFSVCGQPDRIPDTPMTPLASPLPRRTPRDAALDASQRAVDAVTAACDEAVRAGVLATQTHATVAALTLAKDLLRRQLELELRAEAVAAAEATAAAAMRGWERAEKELAAVRVFSANCDTPLSTYQGAIERAAAAARHHAVTCLKDAHTAAEACLLERSALADDWARLKPELRRVQQPGQAAHSLALVARGDGQALLGSVSAALARGTSALCLTSATDRAAAALVGAVAEHQASVQAVLQAVGGSSPLFYRGGPHTV